ncbi:hypothetical protein ACQKO5_22940 [Novosphingobium subterraneum]|uniref:hypothetical protein n=1 Tax=Novosphingobium subterraneum TaxID=48936 RepID=UPI003CFD0CD1
MPDRDPNIVNSALSRQVTDKGITVDVQIYRLEHEPGWTLEVVNQSGTSTVWDTEFSTDEEASSAFKIALDEEGIEAFIDNANVIPFPKRG